MAQRQEDGTFTHASRKLQKHENYGITKMEGLEVVWAVKHFHHCLYVCEALKALLGYYVAGDGFGDSLLPRKEECEY